MLGIRSLLIASASVVVLIPAAEAQSRYQSQAECESNRQGRQVAGAIVGAIIGGVLGAEIEDEIDDRDNYRGHHGYRGRGYHRGRGYRGRGHRGRHRYNEQHENDLYVAAGAGIGALVGAGVAGGDPCAPDHRGYDAGYYGDNFGYNEPYYDQHHSQSAYTYDQAYEHQPSDRIYYGNEGLAGAPRSESRVYQTGIAQTGNCRWMTTRSQNQYGSVTANEVYMCQGVDNIWRPAQ